MSMDPVSGQVKAYVGGLDFTHFMYDMAMEGRRQVGSTIKPFLYSLAMENGYSPCDVAPNVQRTYIVAGKPWTPRNGSRSRYGSMSGTSMATPTTTGIMALWLQANPELTANDIKQVFSQTAVRDSYVTGTNGAHFGKYGKLDALAGLKKIAPCEDVPTITATPTSIDFGNVTAGATTTKTFNVQGANLEGNISLAVSGTGYSISSTSVTKNTAENGTGATITVTFSPTANVSQTYNGTITLTSSNASTVTVNLTGKGVYTAPVIAANPTSLSFSGNSGSTYTKTVTVTSSNLQGNVTAAIQDDANGFYSVSPTSFNAASQTVTVTWTPTAGGTSTANLVLTTTGTGANTVTVPITGTAQGPTITANPTAVTFTGAYATRTYTQTVTVTGTNLSQNITASLTGANVYSIDKTSLGTSGGTITVTYAPTAAGQTQATLTLSSTGASSVTVPITGTAQAATPTLIVEPASLSFTSDLESSDSKTFSVKGRFISENVTLTLTDPNGVFTLGTATIPASSISEETAVNVNVTFQSANEGNFTGSVTVASNGAESQTVNLTATASDGGTASDAYLDITKYATIDEAGWNTSYVNNLYKYTEYDEVAWLTLPVYGAWSSVYYSPKAQKWIATNYNSSPGTSTMGTTTWNKTDIYLGSSEYFTNTTARYFGNQSPQAQSSSNRTMTFYVKNATAVKLFGLNGSRTTGNSGRTYPTTMYIYECKENADGTLIDGTTAVKSFSNNTNNATINFEKQSLTGLGISLVSLPFYLIPINITRMLSHGNVGNERTVAYKDNGGNLSGLYFLITAFVNLPVLIVNPLALRQIAGTAIATFHQGRNQNLGTKEVFIFYKPSPRIIGELHE